MHACVCVRARARACVHVFLFCLNLEKKKRVTILLTTFRFLLIDLPIFTTGTLKGADECVRVGESLHNMSV